MFGCVWRTWLPFVFDENETIFDICKIYVKISFAHVRRPVSFARVIPRVKLYQQTKFVETRGLQPFYVE